MFDYPHQSLEGSKSKNIILRQSIQRFQLLVGVDTVITTEQVKGKTTNILSVAVDHNYLKAWDEKMHSYLFLLPTASIQDVSTCRLKIN